MGWFAIQPAKHQESTSSPTPSQRKNAVVAAHVSGRALGALRRGWLRLGMLGLLLLLAIGCSTDLQSTWDPAGPVASKQLDLFNVLLWVMVAVFVLVEGALLYAIIRYRRRPGQELPAQTHGNLPLEITWTIIPTVLVLALGIWTVFTIFDLDEPPASADNVLDVTVTAHQWWWEFEYPDAGGGKRITTANEMRVPVDVPVRLTLLSDDVIHSFWIPKLAGKLDVVPTRANQMWFQADANEIDEFPATFFGQCAEFCGIAHALMKFRVVVLEQDEYNAWVQNYGPPPEESQRAQDGRLLFQVNCALCHTISPRDAETGKSVLNYDDGPAQASRMEGFMAGTGVTAAPAPNLTDLRNRRSLGAGLLDLNEENLRRWLHNPDDIKPGTSMAARGLIYQSGDISLSDDEMDSIIAYLLNLQ
ncbi:MAG: cytochrome c oxidase subunit II [SAR202 cluster bacterium Io17-Chloro-G9]|nr:MAG: cytochrome c oxidase subunit II [SAR202 cluster bacterium Io17-Chloro-G9]